MAFCTRCSAWWRAWIRKDGRKTRVSSFPSPLRRLVTETDTVLPLPSQSTPAPSPSQSSAPTSLQLSTIRARSPTLHRTALHPGALLSPAASPSPLPPAACLTPLDRRQLRTSSTTTTTACPSPSRIPEALATAYRRNSSINLRIRKRILSLLRLLRQRRAFQSTPSRVTVTRTLTAMVTRLLVRPSQPTAATRAPAPAEVILLPLRSPPPLPPPSSLPFPAPPAPALTPRRQRATATLSRTPPKAAIPLPVSAGPVTASVDRRQRAISCLARVARKDQCRATRTRRRRRYRPCRRC